MNESQEELNRQKRTASRISAFWLAAMAGLFLWQATQYKGVVELLAEWQYRVLDHYYPGLTIAALCLFFSFPLLVMLLILWRRWRKKNEELDDPVAIMLDASRRMGRFYAFMAGLAGGVALLVWVLARLLPTEGPLLTRVDIHNAQVAAIPEGSAQIIGPVDMGALVRFDEKVLLFHRRLYFAPVRYRVHGQVLPARFFVQVEERSEMPSRFVPVMTGVLAHGALPGDVDQLYRNIRYPVEARPYQLYKDSGTLRWRYHMLAVQLVVVAALFALGGWRERRRRKRIEARVEQEMTPE